MTSSMLELKNLCLEKNAFFVISIFSSSFALLSLQIITIKFANYKITYETLLSFYYNTWWDLIRNTYVSITRQLYFYSTISKHRVVFRKFKFLTEQKWKQNNLKIRFLTSFKIFTTNLKQLHPKEIRRNCYWIFFV